MSFDEWCLQRFGITGFREGKIINSVVFPVFPQANIKKHKIIEEHGGYIINTPVLRGYVLTSADCKKLFLQLHSYFLDNHLSERMSFEAFLPEFFKDLDINLIAMSEYKEPSTIHLTFDSAAKMFYFLNAFPQLQPLFSSNVLVRAFALQLPSFAMDYLKNIYYQQVAWRGLKPEFLVEVKGQIAELYKFKKIIARRNISHALDDANILSRDYSNVAQNGVLVFLYQAAGAYALSLRIYAEINRDNLDEGDYLNLLNASLLLASYNLNGHLQQSLKTDAYFVHNLIADYVAPYRWGKYRQTPRFINFPLTVQKKIIDLVEKNCTDLLYGTPNAVLRENVLFKMKRFLPDASMNSETNEIILQAGGMNQHSAVVRLIKVGMLADGTRARWQQKPLYYEYYKVVDNLGMGGKERDIHSKTCLGTYVTRLRPCVLDRGQLFLATIDPVCFTETYQKAMEHTLHLLIVSERYLLLYNSPSTVPAHFPEVDEWRRFYALNKMLSGQPHNEEVLYYGRHPLNSSLPYLYYVKNQRNFYQEGGSCAIFSLKSLVFSLIGPSQASLHSNFMQLNNAFGCFHAINNKIQLLHQCSISMPQAVPVSNKRVLDTSCAFFSRQAAYPKQLERREREEKQGVYPVVV